MSVIFNDINNKINELLSGQEAIINDYKERVKTAIQAEEKANEEYIKAFDLCDEKGCQKASQAQRSARDVRAMYEKRLNDNDKIPLITESEYNAYINEIMQELTRINGEGAQRFIDKVNQMQTLAETVAEEIEEANKLLYKLQHEVFKDKALYTTNTGKKIHLDSLEKKYTAYPLTHYIRYIASHDGNKITVYDELIKHASKVANIDANTNEQE